MSGVSNPWFEISVAVAVALVAIVVVAMCINY
jgi:hypothetical protein